MTRRRLASDQDYAMVALLVSMAVMAIVWSVALPAWSTWMRREKEAEFFFRAGQYQRAIGLYQRARGGNPPNVDVLVTEKFLRKKYKDPLTGDDFQLIGPNGPITGDGSEPARTSGQVLTVGRSGGAASQAQGGVGIIGVSSKSTERSFREYNGRNTYNQMVFMPVQQSSAPGVGGAGGRGVDGRGADGRGGRGNQPQGGVGNQPQGGFGQRPGGPGQPQQPPPRGIEGLRPGQGQPQGRGR